MIHGCPSQDYCPTTTAIPIQKLGSNPPDGPVPSRCHTPSWLDPVEPSHMCIHLTMDHDSTQLTHCMCGQCRTFSDLAISNINKHLWTGRDGVSTQRGALSTPTVHTTDREEGGQDSLGKSKSSFFFNFFLKYFLYFLSYLLIPRHTGHFLVTSGHCQTLSTERGSLLFIVHVRQFYTYGIFRN